MTQSGGGGGQTPKRSFFTAAVIFLFTLVCFLPNQALPVGGNTGLQVGQIVALLSPLTVLVWGWLPKRQTLAILLLISPLLLSTFLVVLLRQALSDEVALKNLIIALAVFVVLLPAGGIVNERLLAPLLSGAASAMILHAGVGAYQAYSFTKDVFPLPSLYKQNPSFSTGIARDLDTWALYVKRPFGLFPEPSAMSASFGPWIVLFVGLLLYPKLGGWTTRVMRTLLLLATASGIGLIIMARSGYMTSLLAILLLIGLPALRKVGLQLHRPRNLLALVGLVLLGATVAILSFTYLNSRLDLQENSSWTARLSSIIWALGYLGSNLTNLFFGVGPGQSYLILQDPNLSGTGEQSSELAVTAVWSVVVSYVQESGLLGALALVLVLIMVLRAILRSSAPLLGSGCLLAWLVGVTLTTSYLPLLPIWIFLGVLLGWDRVFEVRATTPKASDYRVEISPTSKGAEV